MGNGDEDTRGKLPPLDQRVPTVEELRKRFFYRPPRNDQARYHHELVSQLTFGLACELVKICPPGRQLSLALTDLESVRMRANAAIAVDDPRP